MARVRNADYERIAENIASQHHNFKLYLIAAEGDKTEATYFQTIESLFKEANISSVHVEFIDRTEEDKTKSAPQHVYKTITDIEEQLINKGYSIDEKRDELWVIIDVDEYDNRKNSLEALKQASIEKQYFNVALSNPCFEVWLILHYQDIDALGQVVEKNMKQRPKLCKQVLSRLRDAVFKTYTELFELTPIAIERAKKLPQCEVNKSFLEKNICTDVYLLLKKLHQLYEEPISL